MHAELVDKQAVSATVKVTVPASDVDAAFDKVLRSVARQVKIPGFRPGKAPKGVVVKKVGEMAYKQEVRDAIVDDAYPEAMRELELSPIHAHFHADPPEEGEDFEFEVHLDLYPDFELGDIDEIVIDSAPEALGETQIEETVERLRREHATMVPVDRASEPGDVLTVVTVDDADEDGDGEDGDGEDASEDDDADEADGDGMPEASTMPIDLESVEPHLAEQLLGVEIGDVVELELEDPNAPALDLDEEGDTDDEDGDEDEDDDDAPAGLRTLKVRITDVKAKDKPDADDAFAATLGFETWADVESEIRRSLEQQIDQRAFEEQRDEFVDKLLESTDVELPTSLVNRRKMHLLENLASDLEQRGTKLDDYLSSLDENGTRDEFDDELNDAARKGVKRDLVLERLLEERGTELDDDELQRSLTQLAARRGMDPVRFRREQGEEWLANYRFLLTRDKALREVVAAKTGRDLDDPAGGRPQASAGDTAQDGAEADDDDIVDAGSAPAPSDDRD